MKLMVLDGNSIVNRAFYGVRPLNTADGLNTNAIYGFLMILQKLLAEVTPDALCVTFDLKAPTFRHKMYESYKAQRKGMPDELAEQMPYLKDVLSAMRIPCYELAGFEADDLIGTISRICAEKNWECTIVTGDKDSLQLVGENVCVKLIATHGGKTDSTLFDTEKFIEVYGFTPEKLVDLKALMGDSSDNIPGVAGIGEKTAMDLIRRFGTLDHIYEKLDEIDIKKGAREKLRVGEASARMSFTLAKINREVPFEFSLENNLRMENDREKLAVLFRRLEFTKLMDKFGISDMPATQKIRVSGSGGHNWQRLTDADAILDACRKTARVFFVCPKSVDAVSIIAGDTAGTVTHLSCPDYERFVHAFFAENIKKVSHNVKPLMTALLGEKVETQGFEFDTALGAYVLSPTEKDYTLQATAERICSLTLGKPVYEAQGAFDTLDGGVEAIENMQSACSAVESIFAAIAPEIEKLGMHELYYGIELPLCRVLADMEHTGFAVDKNALASYGSMLAEGISRAEESIYALAGEKFNINSPKQLGEILFEKMRLPPVKKTKTGYATDVDILSKLSKFSPIIDEIISYRQLSKLKSTYADGLTKVIRADGRIHTCFNMTVTATGRLSSTEPNLQNIPVRSELGGEIRRMFIPGKKNWKLVDADYSQIELRILAHIADDKMMQQDFMSGEDVHRATAAQVFGVELGDVTPLMRSRAKAVNFGIVYGISKFSLSQDIGVSVAEAGRYMDRYLEKYSGVRDYMKSVVEKAKEDGYVATTFGRRRYLPELKASNRNVRAFGERVALNMPVQGTAADIMKLAMIRVWERLKRENLKARLILQVHDELVCEAPEDEVENVKRILAEEMSGAADFAVPLIVEAGVGGNWYDAK